jgi:hypothetical protein
MLRGLRPICLSPAVGTVGVAAVDPLAEREVAVPAGDTEGQSAATVNERGGGITAAGDVAVCGGVRLRWWTLHAAETKVHRARAGGLDGGAVGVDVETRPVSSPLADKRTTGYREGLASALPAPDQPARTKRR